VWCLFERLLTDPGPAWVSLHMDEQEEARVSEVMSRYTAYEQGPGFDVWEFCRWPDGDIWAKRLSWQIFWSGSLEEVLAQVVDYYERKG